MKRPKLFSCLILCLMMAGLLLSPASYADTDPVNDWMRTVEQSYLDQAYVDMDGAYLGQCVDLAFFYAAELFPEYNFRETIGLGNANQLHWGASQDYFKPITFEGQKPRPGDIVTWDHWAGGHVGIVFQVKSDSFLIYEQNSNMMGTAPVTIREITGPDYGLPYLSYQPIGYLRPIVPQEEAAELAVPDLTEQPN